MGDAETSGVSITESAGGRTSNKSFNEIVKYNILETSMP